MPYATGPEKYSLLTEEYIYSKLAFFGPEVK